MRRRDWIFRVRDILDALASIRNYTATLDFEDFVKDRRTVDAVTRNLIVIGEAASRIPNEVCEENTSVPWMEMRTMRNFVVHEYFGVDDSILWDTI